MTETHRFPKKNMSLQNLFINLKTLGAEESSSNQTQITTPNQKKQYTPRCYEKQNNVTSFITEKYIRITTSSSKHQKTTPAELISPRIVGKDTSNQTNNSSQNRLITLSKAKNTESSVSKGYQYVMTSVKSVSKFDISAIKQQAPQTNNYTGGPSNNIQEQPKRPRILSKVTQSLTKNGSMLEQFKLGKVLGKGRFGNVFLAKHNSTGAVFAIKDISLEKMTDKLAERLAAEIKIQSFLNHKNCLQLYKFFVENKHLYLVLEFGETSLFDILRRKRYFTETETAYYLRQVIYALSYLHENGVIHRDLKPENIIVVNGVAKLADFGWATYTPKEKRITFCGTLDYVSPEIVRGEYYDQMVDVWSVGVLCYELCTGHAPFQSQKSREDTYKKIVNVDLKFPRHLSYNVQNFISRLLVRDPTQRMSLEECLEHPWMKTYESFEDI